MLKLIAALRIGAMYLASYAREVGGIEGYDTLLGLVLSLGSMYEAGEYTYAKGIIAEIETLLGAGENVDGVGNMAMFRAFVLNLDNADCFVDDLKPAFDRRSKIDYPDEEVNKDHDTPMGYNEFAND